MQMIWERYLLCWCWCGFLQQRSKKHSTEAQLCRLQNTINSLNPLHCSLQSILLKWISALVFNALVWRSIQILHLKVVIWAILGPVFWIHMKRVDNACNTKCRIRFIFFSDNNEKNDIDWHSVTKTCTWIWRQPRQTIDTLAII